jgi:hypothetical protein
MIVHMDRDTRPAAEVFERAEARRLVRIHEDEPGDLAAVHVLQPGKPEVVDGQKAADRLLRAGRQSQRRAGIELPRGHHGG